MIRKNKKLYFKGYCCNFFVDKNNDKFLRNSFLFQEEIPILYEHEILIGYTTKILENHFGLYIEFQLFEIMINFISKIPKKLSIGFKCLNFFYKNNIRYIKKAKIIEISLVKNPAQVNTYFY